MAIRGSILKTPAVTLAAHMAISASSSAIRIDIHRRIGEHVDLIVLNHGKQTGYPGDSGSADR